MTYTVNGTQYDSNNFINQRIMREFCNTNIYLDMTAETEFIIYSMNYCGEYNEKLPFDMDDYDEAMMNAYDSGDPNAEYPEIYEWYAVSDRLAELLKIENEVVIDTYDKHLWGRQSFGQVIALDYVIQKIAFKSKVLEGQKYSWENRT